MDREDWIIGIVVVMLIIAVAVTVMTLIGALALWIVCYLIGAEFNWWIALGIGVLLAILMNGMRRS